ncbi:MAG: hypothetical protein ACRC02_04840 [Vogesella sp.]|jgi:hypothetical protein|uniref:hypothetical protein n=1 Tax=Vogesella sp. TaxID=1904252 RepID=UPI003F3439BF
MSKADGCYLAGYCRHRKPAFAPLVLVAKAHHFENWLFGRGDTGLMASHCGHCHVIGSHLTGNTKISLSESGFVLLFVSETVNFAKLYPKAIFK